MSHFSALLNVLESADINKEMATAMFENYLHQYLEMSASEGDEISEQDYATMQEVAHAIGIGKEEFEEILNEDDDEEDDKKKDSEKDKYDRQLDNVVDEHPPGSYELAFDVWAKQPNHDPDTRPTITTPGYAH
jgi:hypothetical protein